MRQLIHTVILTSIVLLFSCHMKQEVNSATATNTTTSKQSYKDITVTEAMKLHEQGDILFLDVRTPEETAEGVIPGAIIADYRSDSFRQEISTLDKSKSYVVYCRSGGRSVQASNLMSEAGFSDLLNMKGGYNSWKEANQ